MRCDTCMFWEKYADSQHNKNEHDDDRSGICSRYPPVFDLAFLMTRLRVDDEIEFDSGEMMFWSQPITVGHNKCGEYKE